MRLPRALVPIALFFPVFLTTLSLTACAQDIPTRDGLTTPSSKAQARRAMGSADSDDTAESEARSGGDAGAATAEEPAARGRKLIRNVALALRVEDTQAVAAELERVTASLGGFVASVDANRYNDLFHYSLVLRVPSARLGEAVERAKGLADEVVRESRGVEDVTDQFVDLEARLRTLEATETELQALLAESRQRRYEVEQVMAVYERLTEIRTRIEQIRGRLQVLDDLTSLGTLRVDLTPTEAARPVIEDGWRPAATAKRALRGLITALQGLGDILIVLLIQVLPILLLVGLPVWWLYRLWQRESAKRRPTEPAVRPRRPPPADPD